MYDCLIVGGGVIGLSLAYELARHKLRVRVIDRGTPGKEASWAGAGILPLAGRYAGMHPWDELRALSHELHPQWAETLRAETGIDTGYRRCGGIYVARSAGEAASLYGLYGLLQQQHVAIERLSPQQLAAAEPALSHLVRSGKLKAAYLLPDEAQLRNPDHLQALLAACIQRGVEVTADVQAEGFDVEGGKLLRVRTNIGDLAADRFCITSGAWTRMLLEQLGIDNGILPIRGQMVLFAATRQLFTHVLNEGPRYLVPRDDGRILVGSTEEEVGFDKSTTDKALAELANLARQLVPELEHAPIERTWAGLRPGSFDGFPYLGVIPGLPNAFVAAGHFRSGLHLSPGTAVVIGRLIRGEDPQFDLTPFYAGRG
jgi:glycine oxidase